MDLILLPLMFGVIYFVMIRPQQKRQQETARMLASIDEGDDVITVGGLYGTVVAVDDDHIDLQVTADGLLLRFRRDAIARVERDEEVASEDSLDSEDSVDALGATATAPPVEAPPTDAVPTDDVTDRA